MIPRPPPLGLAAVLVAAGLIPAAAAEASEGENVLSASLGYAGYSLGDQDASASGVRLGVEYERGVTEGLWLRGQLGGGAYPFGDLTFTGDAGVGVTYAIDVLRYVPYVQGGVGALAVGGEGVDASVYPLVEVGAGLDVLRSRNFSYGIAARVEAFVEGTASVTAGARISYRWGFF